MGSLGVLCHRKVDVIKTSNITDISIEKNVRQESFSLHLVESTQHFEKKTNEIISGSNSLGRWTLLH